jgi:hypothetical protein
VHARGLDQDLDWSGNDYAIFRRQATEEVESAVAVSKLARRDAMHMLYQPKGLSLDVSLNHSDETCRGLWSSFGAAPGTLRLIDMLSREVKTDVHTKAAQNPQFRYLPHLGN